MQPSQTSYLVEAECDVEHFNSAVNAPTLVPLVLHPLEQVARKVAAQIAVASEAECEVLPAATIPQLANNVVFQHRRARAQC